VIYFNILQSFTKPLTAKQTELKQPHKNGIPKRFEAEVIITINRFKLFFK